MKPSAPMEFFAAKEKYRAMIDALRGIKLRAPATFDEQPVPPRPVETLLADINHQLQVISDRLDAAGTPKEPRFVPPPVNEPVAALLGSEPLLPYRYQRRKRK